MSYPSTIGSFTNPTSANRLNSPSHSSIETAQNNELVQIETVIGTDSSILGTIIGDLRNTNSNGGGHVQTVNKGGTGLTAYSKGDLLVATSQSVLSKLAVGTDGQIVTADSTAQAGIKWSGSPAVPSVLSLLPRSTTILDPSTTDFIGTTTMNTNSSMLVGLVSVPFQITANLLTAIKYTVSTPGQILIGMYPEHGQHSIFTASTVALTGSNSVISIALPSIVIPPGQYYLGVAPVSSTVVAFPTWVNRFSDIDEGYASVVGKTFMHGAVSIVAGTLPAAITSSIKGLTLSTTPAIRFDN